MKGILATELLRTDVLAGSTLALARVSPPGNAAETSAIAAIGTGAAELGAHVLDWPVELAGPAWETDAHDLDAGLTRVLDQAGEVDVLVVDAGDIFAASAGLPGEPESARLALRACLQVSWDLTRALVSRAFIERERPGRILLLAPAPHAGVHARAARAGLENLARTLSIEWARHRLTAVAIAPGQQTAAADVAAVAAYLASPAGAYFSGCVLEMGALGG